MGSDDADKWVKAMSAELKAQSSTGKRFMESGPEDEGTPTDRMQMGIR